MRQFVQIAAVLAECGRQPVVGLESALTGDVRRMVWLDTVLTQEGSKGAGLCFWLCWRLGLRIQTQPAPDVGLDVFLVQALEFGLNLVVGSLLDGEFLILWTILHPGLELLPRHGCHGLEPLPPLGIVGLVDLARLESVLGADDDLVFVELAGGRVNLIDHEHLAGIVGRRARLDEGVDMVLVVADRALDVAVVVLEGVGPGLAALVRSAARGARRILDGQVQATHHNVALLVVAFFLLRVRGFGQIIARAGGGLVRRRVDYRRACWCCSLSRVFHGRGCCGLCSSAARID